MNDKNKKTTPRQRGGKIKQGSMLKHTTQHAYIILPPDVKINTKRRKNEKKSRIIVSNNERK